MKKFFAIALAAVMLPLALNAQDIKIMSYNIRNGEAKDGTNSWMYRYASTAEMIKEQQADVWGIQEALEDQIYFIEQNFREYKYVGAGSEDGKKKGEYTAIFWNKKTMSMQDWGMLWLSETPDAPSKGWDGEKNCTATWALMKDKKSGNRFYFVNIDIDEKGTEARRNSIRLIMDRIASINKNSLPVVLVGGFDMKPYDALLTSVEENMSNARKTAEKTDNTGTYNNWGKNSDILDHVFYSGFSACPEYQTVTKKYAEHKFVSDHYPMMVRLSF